MPRQVVQKISKNNQLHFTLPTGARQMLDQLVALKVVGASHSAVIAFLVQTQLQAMKRDFALEVASLQPPSKDSA